MPLKKAIEGNRMSLQLGCHLVYMTHSAEQTHFPRNSASLPPLFWSYNLGQSEHNEKSFDCVSVGLGTKLSHWVKWTWISAGGLF